MISSYKTRLINFLFDSKFRRHVDHASNYDAMYAAELRYIEETSRTHLEERGFDGKLYQELLATLQRVLSRAGQSPNSILEIGAGSGYLALRLGAPTTIVHLVDRSRAACELARRLAVLLHKQDQTVIHEHDLFTWRPPRLFDVVLSIGLYEELDDQRQERFIRLAVDSVRPGGIVIIGVPNFWSPAMLSIWKQHGKADERYIPTDSLRAALRKAGLRQVQSISGGAVTYSPDCTLADHLLPWLKMIHFAWSKR